MKFRATLELGGKTATGIEIPPEVVAALGSSKKPAVRITIGSHCYRSTVATMGGRFMVGVSADNRAAAGVVAGDEVDVEIELDAAPRVVAVPPDFAEALEREHAAKTTFDTISPSNKGWHVHSIESAKSAETRQRRIDKSIGILREGRAR